MKICYLLLSREITRLIILFHKVHKNQGDIKYVDKC